MHQSLVGEVADIAGIAILSDQLECDLFAAATDEEWNVGLLHALWLVDRAVNLEILSLENGAVVVPHLEDDLYGIAKLAQARWPIGIVVAIGDELIFVPACANAEIQASVTEDIDCAGHLCQEGGIAIAIACDHLSDADTFGVASQRGGTGPAFEGDFLGRSRNGVEMVVEPD